MQIRNEKSFMSKEKILACSWKEFEEKTRKALGSDFIWRTGPRNIEINRQMVMESVERMLRENNGTFPKKGDMFIEPEKGEPISPAAEI